MVEMFLKHKSWECDIKRKILKNQNFKKKKANEKITKIPHESRQKVQIFTKLVTFLHWFNCSKTPFGFTNFVIVN
jgi:hypothetical protein